MLGQLQQPSLLGQRRGPLLHQKAIARCAPVARLVLNTMVCAGVR